MIVKYLEFYDQILLGHAVNLPAAALRISHRTISNSGDLTWNFGRSRHNVSGYGSILFACATFPSIGACP